MIYELNNMTIAIAAFGRMNPVTIGHRKLAKEMKKAADKYKGTPLLYLSHSYDGVGSGKFPKKGGPKNPLSYKDKLEFVRDTMNNIVTVVESRAVSPWEMLHELYEDGIEAVYMFGGSDRVEEYERVMDYNGKGDPSDSKFFYFDKLEIASGGERDENSEDAESKASGSLLRRLVTEQDYEEFEKYAGPLTLKEEMFDTLLYEMKVT